MDRCETESEERDNDKNVVHSPHFVTSTRLKGC